MSLKLLKNKWVRYWLPGEQNATCSYARILDFDATGVLFSGPESGTLEGCEWHQYHTIACISYYNADQAELQSEAKQWEKQKRNQE